MVDAFIWILFYQIALIDLVEKQQQGLQHETRRIAYITLV